MRKADRVGRSIGIGMGIGRLLHKRRQGAVVVEHQNGGSVAAGNPLEEWVCNELTVS